MSRLSKYTEEQLIQREIQFKTLEECQNWVSDYDGFAEYQTVTDLHKQRILELEANYKTKSQKA
jgi:hypothetical protein